MHLLTVVKLRADSPEEAIEKAQSLVTNGDSYDIYPFDYVSPDCCEILPDFTEQDEIEHRNMEIKSHDNFLQQAMAIPESQRTTHPMYGYYLRTAGEAIEADRFWSTERCFYDAAKENCLDCADGEHIYYVQTDRHC